MATYERHEVPVSVQIKNIATPIPTDDAGTRPDKDGNKFITAKRDIQLYKQNMYQTLDQGEDFTVQARTSDELNFYLTNYNDGKNFEAVVLP